MAEVYLTIIPCFLAWMLSTVLNAFFQGHYFDTVPTDTKGHPDMHPVFVMERGLFLSALSVIVGLQLGFWNGVIFFTGQCFTYSFIHNGVLYAIRNKLNPAVYPKGFMADPEKEGPTEYSFVLRSWMFALGSLFTVGIILNFIYQ